MIKAGRAGVGGARQGGVVLEADLGAGIWELKLGPCKEVKQNS